MDNKNYNEEEQVAWNLSEGIIVEIQQLLAKANRLYINHKFISAYKHLKAIKGRFIQSLKSDERKLLTRKERKINRCIFLYRSERGAGYYPENAKSLKWKYWLEKLYENYNETIMDLLDSYSYLVAKKQDTKSII